MRCTADEKLYCVVSALPVALCHELVKRLSSNSIDRLSSLLFFVHPAPCISSSLPRPRTLGCLSGLVDHLLMIQAPIKKSAHVLFPQNAILRPYQHPGKPPLKHGRDLPKEIKRHSRPPQAMPQLPLGQPPFLVAVELFEKVLERLRSESTF